jgi:transcriptional regulator GlxA family with amidase domain
MQGKPSHAQRHLLLVFSSLRSRAETRASTTPAQPVEAPLQRSLDAMQTQLSKRWTVVALARLAGMSRPVYARKFAEALGESPLRYLARQRMRRAAQLLTETELSLSEVAARIGYVSEFAFNRAFKRHYFIAPGGYRRRMRQAETPLLRAA